MTRIKIQLLATLYLTLFAFLFTECRYKDNKNISLLSVKKRLCRTWQLTEALDLNKNIDLIALDSKLFLEELTFEKINNDTLLFKTPSHKGGLVCILKENKKQIHYWGASENTYLTITKLTNKELWLEGAPNGGICYSCSVEQNVKLKYKAK